MRACPSYPAECVMVTGSAMYHRLAEHWKTKNRPHRAQSIDLIGPVLLPRIGTGKRVFDRLRSCWHHVEVSIHVLATAKTAALVTVTGLP